MKKASKVSLISENFIIVVILLVLVQTFLEDFSVISLWSWNVRKIILIFGFAFDFIFVVEFLVRFYAALAGRELKAYLFHRRGWLDFISSFPLLILNSGPTFLTIVLAGSAVFRLGSILNILKVVKAIRIARILRLLRVLKIFKQIKHADSEMAQRHVAKITTLTLSAIIFVIFVFSLLTNVLRLPSVENDMARKSGLLLDKITRELEAGQTGAATDLARLDGDILIIKRQSATVYSRYTNDEYTKYFGPADYRYESLNGYDIFLDYRGIQRHGARENIVYFIVIVVLVLIFLTYYSPHFALTVTDPIHIMRKGMTDPAYNLEVKVPETLADDDIYLLAAAYNEVFLPLKDRSAAGDENNPPLVELDIGDIKGLFDEKGPS